MTNAERKKYIKDVLSYREVLLKNTAAGVDHTLKKWDTHFEWVEDTLDDMCKTIQDVLDAKSAEDAKKRVQSFRDSHIW